MAHVIINRKNNTIEITKDFDKKASIYGSKSYEELMEIQNAHPTFRIVVKSTHRKSSPLGKISAKDMEKYIKEHDNTGNLLKEFYKLRGKDENGKDIEEEGFRINTAVPFVDLKKWFVKNFSEIEQMIEERKKEVEKILNGEVA